MNIMQHVLEKVKQIFDEDELTRIAKETGFIKRVRKIKAKLFLEQLLVHQLQMPQLSLQALATEVVEEGCGLSKQSLHQKLTYAGKEFLRSVLERCLETGFREVKSFKGLEGIRSIHVIDSTQIALWEGFEALYPKTQGRGAAIKIQACLEVMRHQIKSLDIRPAREPDQGYGGILDHLEAETLHIGDLGYFRIDTFRAIEAAGGFFLSRYFKATSIYAPGSEQGVLLREQLNASQEQTVEFPVLLGKQEKFPCRFIAVRLSQEAYEKRMRRWEGKQKRSRVKVGDPQDELNRWNLFVTNLATTLPAEQICHLYFLRWQIELFFKAVKSGWEMRALNHRNLHRAAMSLYVNLISVVVLNVLMFPLLEKELSFYKAAKVWKRKIGEFFEFFKENAEQAVLWLQERLVQLAFKETRPQRLSSKAKVLDYA